MKKIGKIEINDEMKKSVEKFPDRCWLGDLRNLEYELKSVKDENSERWCQYCKKIWKKRYGCEDLGCLSFYRDYEAGWHRDKGSGRNVIVLSLGDGWLKEEKEFQKLEEGDLVEFNGQKNHCGRVSGLVMFQRKKS